MGLNNLEVNVLTLQPNHRHTLAPFPRAAGFEISHIAIIPKDRSNRLAQLSGALAVDHTYEGHAGKIRGIQTPLQHLKGFVDSLSS